MDWLFVCLALTPLVFCPTLLFNCFALPQLLVVSLLSATSLMVVLAGGELYLSSTTMTLFLFFIYFILASFRTNPVHNAKKEAGLQIPFFLLFFVLPIYVSPSSIKAYMIAVTLASGAICLYAHGQMKLFDPFFSNSKKCGGPKDNAIGTIGNPNFLSSYLSGCFWLSVYAAVNYGYYYLTISALILVIIYKSRSRAGQLAIVGSSIFLVLMVSCKGWIAHSDMVFVSVLAFVILVAMFIISMVKVYWKTFWHDPIDPDAQRRIWYASFRYRLCFWLVALHLLKERWLFGWGPWSYRREVYRGQAELNEKYPGFMDQKRYITPQPRECHNDWLECLFEFGVVGGSIFFLFVGMVFFDGLSIINNFSNALLFTNLVAIVIDACFFFALRIPASSIQFWITCVIITALSGKGAIYSFQFPWWVLLILISIMILFVWEFVIKRVITSRYLYLVLSTSDPEKRYFWMMRGLAISPYDTTLRTHATVETATYAPVVSILHANKMLEHYDGQTVLWSAFYNYALAWLKGYQNFFDVMTYYLKTGHWLLPYFKPIKGLLSGRQSVSLKSQYIGGAEMRVMENATLWKIRTFLANFDSLGKDIQILNQEMEKIQLRIQNAQAQMELAKANVENMVLYEKKRMNIPDDWIFDSNEGVFKGMDNLTEQQKKEMGIVEG